MATRSAAAIRLRGTTTIRVLSREQSPPVRRLHRLDLARRPPRSSSSFPSGSRALGGSTAASRSSSWSSVAPRGLLVDYPNASTTTTTTATIGGGGGSDDRRRPEKKRGDGTRRSPHSKLLRVCSDRSANPHFAAIEADMLRLDWHAAMNDLVEDWSGKGRFGDLVELEGSVRGYVENNLVDLTHYYESERDGGGDGNDGPGRGGVGGGGGVSIADRLRLRLFPHGRVVTAAVRRAVSGIGDVRGSVATLSDAGRILDAMTTSLDGDDDDDDVGCTVRHEKCSNCLRQIVSGWFLLHRRSPGADGGRTAPPAGSTSSPAVDDAPAVARSVSPERETLVWADRWIDFCDDRGRRGGGTAPRGGISASDGPLLMGVARMIASGERRTEFAHLNEKIRGLFSD